MAKALGRGLSALLGESAHETFQAEKLYLVPVKEIAPDPEQPRKGLDQEAMLSLTESVRAHGVLQPLLLKAVDKGYLIIAGERRWRAAVSAGVTEVPARVIDVSDRDLREISLVENIQREDLSPLELASAIQAMIGKFGLTQEDVAKRIGWSRTALTNCLRLLNLPDEVKEMLSAGRLSEGHARTLLSLEREQMLAFAERACDGKMTVRQLEALVKTPHEPAAAPERGPSKRVKLPPSLAALAKESGVRVKIDRRGTVARVVLEGLAAGDDELTAVLEDCLTKLRAQ